MCSEKKHNLDCFPTQIHIISLGKINMNGNCIKSYILYIIGLKCLSKLTIIVFIINDCLTMNGNRLQMILVCPVVTQQKHYKCMPLINTLRCLLLIQKHVVVPHSMTFSITLHLLNVIFWYLCILEN